MHELETEISFVKPIGEKIFMKKGNTMLLYNKEFELEMKDEIKESKCLKISQITTDVFLIAIEGQLFHWDTK